MDTLARFEVVESECIGCALCPERAPDNVQMVEGQSLARIVAQPSSREEELACIEASEYCPLGALAPVTPEPSDEDTRAAVAATAPPS